MEKHVRDTFTEDILAEALLKMGADPSSARLLDGFESHVFEFTKKGVAHILRISHSSHRSWEMIKGEFEWLSYLIGHGLPVAKPVKSLAGRDVEVIGAQGNADVRQNLQADHSNAYWTAGVFEKAPGRLPQKSDRTGELYRQMGALTGRMHALTKFFTPSRPQYRRGTWKDQAISVQSDLFREETGVLAVYLDLLEYVGGLPQSPDCYGLIHTDFHFENFFVDDGNITLFDFDDSCYAWFVYDIAMSLFYALSHNCVLEEDLNKGRDFLSNYMKGYLRENNLDLSWLLQIPCFLKLREIELYLAILESGDIESLGAWGSSYMKDRRLKIENGVPYANLDFASVARSIISKNGAVRT